MECCRPYLTSCLNAFTILSVPKKTNYAYIYLMQLFRITLRVGKILVKMVSARCRRIECDTSAIASQDSQV